MARCLPLLCYSKFLFASQVPHCVEHKSCSPSRMKIRRFTEKEILEHTGIDRLITSVYVFHGTSFIQWQLECAVKNFRDHLGESLRISDTICSGRVVKSSTRLPGPTRQAMTRSRGYSKRAPLARHAALAAHAACPAYDGTAPQIVDCPYLCQPTLLT
jgi:hypothetical protein